MIEDGHTYDTLRGVSIEGRAEIIDPIPISLLGSASASGSATPAPTGDDMRPFVDQMMHNRIAIRVVPERTRSWDHRKLGMPEMPFSGSTAQYLA